MRGRFETFSPKLLLCLASAYVLYPLFLVIAYAGLGNEFLGGVTMMGFVQFANFQEFGIWPTLAGVVVSICWQLITMRPTSPIHRP